MSDDFTFKTLRAPAKRVHRLGLALNYGLDGPGLSRALERGVNYFFWTSLRTGKTTPVLRDALKRDRERYVVAGTPTVGFLASGVRRGAEAILKKLGTDYLDVLQLGMARRRVGVDRGHHRGAGEAPRGGEGAGHRGVDP